MKDRLLIHPKFQQAYIPKRIILAGFSGNCETLSSAVTITILRPGACLEDIKRSLEITIQDIDLQMKQEMKEVE